MLKRVVRFCQLLLPPSEVDLYRVVILLARLREVGPAEVAEDRDEQEHQHEHHHGESSEQNYLRPDRQRVSRCRL